jgi:GR25 family glycosyltransferase involved in LPS biosynthesis
VKTLVQRTKGTVVSAVMLDNGKDGCRASHLAVARLARGLHPDKHYLVFEDDCVLSEDWEKCIEGMEMADVLYLGYNDKCSHTTFGTHALLISPKARDKIVSDSEKLKDEVIDKGAYDHVLSKLCRQEGLLTAMPPVDEKDRWAWQKKGLKSTITGQLR